MMNNSIREGENLHNSLLSVPEKNATYLINSSIVRSRKGQPTGAIFVLVQGAQSDKANSV
jgi:hypothetical protein